MLYFNISFLKSGKLSLQNHVKTSASLVWAGCTSGRRVQGSLPGIVCIAPGPLYFPMRAPYGSDGVFFFLCGCEWPVLALRPLNLIFGRGQVCSCGEVSRNGNRPGHSLSTGSCAHGQGPPTAVPRPRRSEFCPGGIRGGGDASVTGSGWGRWRVTSLLLCTW